MRHTRFDEQQATAAPSTEIERLMMLHSDTYDDSNDHIEVVAAAVEQLCDESRWILQAIYSERITYQELGDRLGVSKPHAWRLTQRAVQELRTLIEHHPTLRGRYRMQPTWQDGCSNVLHKLLFARPQGAQPLTSDMIPAIREQLVNQFDTTEEYVVGVAALAQAAWRRLWEEGHEPIVEGICALLARKQHDYGHLNITSFGQRGIIVRLCDKLSRLENLDRKDIDPSNESLLDTLFDIIGYCTISRMLTDGSFHLELGELA